MYSWGNALKSDAKGIAADNSPVMMVDPDGHLAWFVPVAKLAVKQPLKYKYKTTVAGQITEYT